MPNLDTWGFSENNLTTIAFDTFRFQNKYNIMFLDGNPLTNIETGAFVLPKETGNLIFTLRKKYI